MTTGHPDALGLLIERSKQHAFTLEDLDWDLPVDRDRFWSPVEISPLYHLPSFANLPTEIQKRYNQLFAMGVCEQFVWLEEHILVKTLNRVIKTEKLPEDFKQSLEIFVEEEIKHTEMFWRILEKAEPGWYCSSRGRHFNLYNISRAQQFMLDVILKYPMTFLIWIWTAIFFEERTVDYCKHYLVFDKRNRNELDQAFLMLHRYHYKDEVRHYQLDQHILKFLYDPQPGWKRKLCGNMFFRLIKTYTSPKRTSLRVLEILRSEFPEADSSLFDSLEAQLPQLATSESFQKVGFSRQAIRKTLELFTRYPELDRIWDLFIHENKQDHVKV